ncbi:MAG: TonB-dependent receptor, partial [Sporomusa sp.]
MVKQQQKKLLCTLLSGALFWGLPGVALAEETEEVFSMDEIVVTASRIATKITETAADVTVINRDEMEKKNMKTVTEALVQSGVKIEAEGGGAADVSRVILNGSERVIILVDGRKVNWEQNSGFEKGGPDLASLPSLSSIERIEVVRGAASSLYGSAGVGGVVNIITRKGEENRIQASTEFGSWNARRYNVQAGGKSGDTGYMVTAERSTQNNYEYKEPTTGQVVTMPNSDFTRNTASVRLDKDLGEDRTLTFYFDHLSEEAGYPIAKPGLMNHNPYAVRQTVQNNVSLAYKWQQGKNITNNFQIYRN